MKEHPIAIVVAIGRNRELGKGNRLLWKIPGDVQRFRELTRGHPLIMGRKTFESILGYRGGPLPDRTNIVITRQDPKTYIEQFSVDLSGVIIVPTLEEAIEKAKESPGSEEIHIGGGAQIYEQALPLVDKLYLTFIDAEDKEADSFFPAYEDQFKKETFREEHDWNGIKYTYVNLERE